MTSTPKVPPQECYFCRQQAAVAPGRNSYLVDCPTCRVSYELDLTAAATEPANRAAILERVRRLIATGQNRPVVTLEDVAPK